ncbi:hypothetical protein BG005_009883, partial [Podila minutissima]
MLAIAYLRVYIHRELTWTLCSPIFEQLQTIVIPLSDNHSPMPESSGPKTEQRLFILHCLDLDYSR